MVVIVDLDKAILMQTTPGVVKKGKLTDAVLDFLRGAYAVGCDDYAVTDTSVVALKSKAATRRDS